MLQKEGDAAGCLFENRDLMAVLIFYIPSSFLYANAGRPSSIAYCTMYGPNHASSHLRSQERDALGSFSDILASLASLSRQASVGYLHLGVREKLHH